MGLTFVEGKVTGPKGQARVVDFLVDSGATYSLLPENVWRELGLQGTDTYRFTLADGTKIEREVSECRIALNGTERHTPVILGVAGDEPLIGVVTLEILGLVLDPFQRKLQKMKMRLG